ncbi:peptidoglycan DD-metalloendopeptidase family protein [Neptunicella marina]|uniref:Peptidoglycan DD-metalloendopeptidase family protein n=1 Tax=Neptunicella marina TaxID=2125989 RepID=A0A8J6M099_9ALTE|nr:peptidoglycan DD-metalloendopeptidase family protein [Neptunicella marina]
MLFAINKHKWGPLLALILFVVPATQAQEQEKQKLDDIQQQIKDKQKQIETNLAQAKALEAQLKQQELAIAKSAKALNQTRDDLRETQAQQKQLKQRQRELQTKQDQQESVLAKQLRSAYMAGNHDYAKMIFNLQSASAFERMLTYYQYLNTERQQQIDEFKQRGIELAAIAGQLLEKASKLKQLEQDQQQQQQQLASQQKQREQTLASLTKKIDSDAEKVEQLQINEQTLLQALQAAQEKARQAERSDSEITLNGLAKQRGKLIHPVDGRMRRLFGARRQGQVRWKGILIYADEGKQVQAVDDARVLYADWLKGFGLVIALDHGDGYMSLYGHNQALLKQVGDSVHRGDSIALVGQSGGQSRPGLYFEIRHKGEPVNPSKWLVR